MASCCSRRCPVFFAISVTLAIVAISSVVHSLSKNNSDQESPISITHNHYLSLNASIALRKAGFNLMADLFQRSPPFFLPPHNSTFFAIKDSAFKKNTSSLPPWLLKNILLFHTSPSMASMHHLLNKPPGTCIPTLFRHKNIAITKIHPQQKLVEINHVLISNPDIYLHRDQFAIHGVQDFIQYSSSPSCRSSSGIDESKNVIWWNRVIQSLSSKGYASFSIGLHSVLEGIRMDSTGFDSVTILAPPDLGLLLGSSSPMLDRAVRLHILPQRFTYRELSSLPRRTLLKTLMPDQELEIDGVSGFMSVLVVNGVEIVAPDVMTSDNFVIHGISRAFELDQLGLS